MRCPGRSRRTLPASAAASCAKWLQKRSWHSCVDLSAGQWKLITLSVSDRDPNAECTEGLSDNYLQLRLAESMLPNQWIRAHVEKIMDGELVGVAG